MKKEGLLMGVKKEKGRKRFRKRKTYGNQILPLELLIEKNKREIINSEELMEEIYMKIDEKHTQCVTKYKKTR
ncbi:FbpB family small basic protein [Bacillus subtilis]|nr:FbpB family small basic protein [Bacillus subtilis]